jgi:copper(I)-binding protein
LVTAFKRTAAVRIAVLSLAVLGSQAFARDYKHGPLTIVQPWSRATPKGAGVAAGYLTITNNGSAPDRLIAATAAFAPRVEMHETKAAGDVTTMRERGGGIEIKPGETVELKPGATHLMFINPSAPLRAGQSVKGTLIFKQAGAIEVEYQVEPIGGTPKAHGGSHQGH